MSDVAVQEIAQQADDLQVQRELFGQQVEEEQQRQEHLGGHCRGRRRRRKGRRRSRRGGWGGQGCVLAGEGTLRVATAAAAHHEDF